MLEYLLILMPVFLATLGYRRNTGVYVVVSLYVMLIAGVRLNVGYDYPAYVEMYDLTIEPNLEFLSDLLMQASRALGDSQYYFLLTSTIVVGCVAGALWRYSRDPLLALWVFICMPYMFLVSLGIVRQYTAIALGFYLLSFYSQLGLTRLLPLLICAGLLHSSAYILLPIAFLWRVLARPLPAWIILGSLLPLYSLSGVARDIASANIPFPEVYFGDGDNGFKLYIMYVLVLVLLLTFRRRAGLDNDGTRQLNLFYIGVALFSLTVGLSEAAARISYYFLIFVAPLLPRYIGCFRPSTVVRALMISVLLLLFILQLSIASNNPVIDPYIPYQINSHFLLRVL